ncbi:MAG: hypothetical protein OXC99_02380 [Chloroflexi bacterium]|nr:hypothetical protein [Chloroflexota bacterium]
MKRMRMLLAAAAALALSLAMAACGGGGEPQEHTINIELEGGQLAGSTSGWQVNADDRVTMIVRSDEPVNFHLHGYDFEENIEPGDPATFIFTANATGSFPITIHHAAPGMASGDHEADHAAGVEAPEGMSVSVEAVPDSVAGLNVRISTTNFTFAPEQVGDAHVQGNGHAHVYVDGVKVGRPYGEHYHVSPVEPGERTVRVTLNANNHSEYTVGGNVVEDTITVTVPGGDDTGGHDEGAEDAATVEAELGRFEVRP